MKDLFPAPFQLLTKREKKCKDCNKVLIKPNMNPQSMEKMKCEFLMLHYAPKVMIYRKGKFNPSKGMSQEIEFMLKFINSEEDQVWMKLLPNENAQFANP